MNKLVSIVISAYNERDNLPPLMSQLKEVLSYNSRFIFQDQLAILNQRFYNLVDVGFSNF